MFQMDASPGSVEREKIILQRREVIRIGLNHALKSEELN